MEEIGWKFEIASIFLCLGPCTTPGIVLNYVVHAIATPILGKNKNSVAIAPVCNNKKMKH